ncbi:MAG: ABC transporter, permease protein 1 (cluster 1, maltose/g3p/polyamine/iron) [uncultured Friedmanniella sp.]|uniref:ABC transporter, permease protein 1 (Cluster 1, maltose/g3p/polyamine/iron) n=1 Tax=uncultured Friedmanniella sp. TaxID=335381 RepID=A0A6J4K5N7_9ACTN|nr:sugar ABC transporter permease [uncultured Friedmanniella sp.]CAA9296648.1 MAG: ABC transporter, permease protein 1 (cluster 1, maltose/g3p/polyamine/iron) [uncultured Friedmanniella sp.]
MTSYTSSARVTARAEGATLVPAHRRGVLWRMRRNVSAYVFLSVPLLLFCVFTVFALIFAFYLTFHEWSIIEPERPFVGLQNYRDMLDDESYLRSIGNTFYFTGVSVPVTMAIGLLVALLLNLPLRARGMFRTLYFLPVVTPFVVVSIIWKWLYNGDFGLFNYYLLKANLIEKPLLFLADRDLAMPAVILMSIWSGVGFSMVVYLAALQAIPEELYEAARVDGASRISQLWYITVPMLRPTTLFLAVIGIIGAFQVFTQIFIMTSGGPVERTTTVVYFIYNAAFKFYEFGYASTLAFGLFALLFVFTLLQLHLYRKGE